ncbi:KR prefix domain-containing protein [Actinomadura madurae]|uniref:KR prefix domain-containing protein n=1 Tax=Actinomadura madurae TaxID=1993 RepID=UPI0020D247EC|nr:hypothetical protein [Actinomadura madurae]MCQ0016726.1 hypothetical protein [Actinomadura madurae]
MSGESAVAEPPDEGPLYVPTWTETTPPRTAADDGGTWVVFAHPGEAVTDELIRLMRAAGENVVVVSPGGRYAETGDGRRTVRPRESADYGRLAAAVLGAGPGRVRLVHAWLLGGVPARTERAAVRGHLDLGLFSLLPAVQEFSRRASGASGAALELSVLTSGMQDVLGDGDVHPAKAAVRGLLKTLPRELRSVTVRGVDVGRAMEEPAGRRPSPLSCSGSSGPARRSGKWRCAGARGGSRVTPRPGSTRPRTCRPCSGRRASTSSPAAWAVSAWTWPGSWRGWCGRGSCWWAGRACRPAPSGSRSPPGRRTRR